MKDKDSAIAAAMALLIKEGYDITYISAPTGKSGVGMHLHVVDEHTLIKGEKE